MKLGFSAQVFDLLGFIGIFLYGPNSVLYLLLSFKVNGVAWDLKPYSNWSLEFHSDLLVQANSPNQIKPQMKLPCPPALMMTRFQHESIPHPRFSGTWITCNWAKVPLSSLQAFLWTRAELHVCDTTTVQVTAFCDFWVPHESFAQLCHSSV